MSSGLVCIGAIPAQDRQALKKTLSLFAKSGADSLMVEDARKFVNLICNCKSPSWLFRSDMGKKILVRAWGKTGRGDESWKALAIGISEITDRILYGKGYRSRIVYTWQEHKLMGSTVGHEDSPYVPIGILDGAVSLEEARLARELLVFERFIASYFGGARGFSYKFGLLEPLGENGMTLRDPRAINQKTFERLVKKGAQYEEAVESSLLAVRKRDDFPVRRD